MEIKTQEYKVSRNEILFAILRYHCRASLLIIIILYVLGCFATIQNGKSLLPLTMFLFVFVLYYFMSYWWHAKKLADGIYAKKRVLALKDDSFYVHIEDGSETKINIKNINKIISSKNYYLVYLSKVVFFYVPKRAFFPEEDSRNFYNFLMKTSVRNQIKGKKKRHVRRHVRCQALFRDS